MESQPGINLSEVVSAAQNATETGMEAPQTSADRIKEAALGAGLPRAEKAIEALAMALGAGEAAKMAGTIVGEKARATQMSAAERLNQAATGFEEDLTTQLDLLGKGMTEVKDKSVARAKDLGKRALTKGLSAMTWLADKVVAVFEIPAGRAERAAGAQVTKAQAGAEQYARQVVDQMTTKANLTTEQRAALEEFLIQQEVERQGLAETQEEERALLNKEITDAREKATKLRTDAANRRTKVEGYRFFKGLLAKIKG